ncbi:uncharacterized protein LOC118480511 [Helianthus annuus]|uniref:uncharacterized protein LOC118480511 n=1 Tax=Helianthus annuus TaxID=4232 RepID=UPI0016533E44|nr:uncharacterized protein LOC118480511 [Helianthus annuus]
MPYQFKILNDKKYAFKIQISHFNIDNHTDGYAVHKLVNDPAIIESLESRIPADQGVDEPDANVSLSDLSTQNPFALKEAVDSIGDSFTPDCTSKDCSKTSSAELKRNLADVYEVEETTSLSSTKVKKTGDAYVTIDGVETIMLVPKIEK